VDDDLQVLDSWIGGQDLAASHARAGGSPQDRAGHG
jgi:hypothetical protein